MDLSIIILSYDTKEITDECLKRLQGAVDRVQKMGDKAEVIVLDNASSDGSAEMIKENHPWVSLIESKENTGYSKGNNLAFKKSKYPNVLFLNSDVYVKDYTLEKALKYFKGHECDALGVKLLYEDGKLQPSAGNLPDPLNTVFWILGIGQLFNPFHPKNPAYFSKDSRVGWIMGAFLLIRREVFEKIGGFDEDIFMYMDEVDFCKRIYMVGCKVCFTPSVQVVHLHGASSKFDPTLAFKNELKGLKYYFGKYYPRQYPMVKIFLVLGLILRVIAFSLLGKTKRARAYLEGLSLI